MYSRANSHCNWNLQRFQLPDFFFISKNGHYTKQQSVLAKWNRIQLCRNLFIELSILEQWSASKRERERKKIQPILIMATVQNVDPIHKLPCRRLSIRRHTHKLTNWFHCKLLANVPRRKIKINCAQIDDFWRWRKNFRCIDRMLNTATKCQWESNSATFADLLAPCRCADAVRLHLLN